MKRSVSYKLIGALVFVQVALLGCENEFIYKEIQKACVRPPSSAAHGTNPGPVITSPTSDFPSNGPVTVSGTCEDNFEVTLFGSGVQQEVAVSCVGGHFAADISLDGTDGIKDIQIRQEGLDNGGEDRLCFLKDTVPPAVNIRGTSGAQAVNQVTININGTCEDGLDVAIDGPGVVSPVTTSCSAGEFNAPVTFTNIDGVKNVVATQEDPAGNTGQDDQDYLKDTTAPVVRFTTPAPMTYGQNDLTVGGNCEGSIPVLITGPGLGSALVRTDCVGGNFSSVVPLSAGDGIKPMVASQTDAAGNTGNDNRDFMRDGTPPVVTIASPAANTPASSGLAVSGLCEDGLPVTLNGSGVAGSQSTNCSGGTYSADILFSAGDGVKEVVASQTDALGNYGSDRRNFMRDGQAPMVQILNPAPNTVAQTGVRLEGICEDAYTVNLGGAGLLGPSSTTCSGGTFAVDINFTNGDGSKNISASQTDGAGNTGSDSRSFIRDNTGPNLAITSPPSGTRAQSGVQLEGVCENGLSIDLGGSGLSTPNMTTCSAGVFSIFVNFTNGEGTKTITASQTDAANNTTTDSRDFIRDNSGPSVTITGPAAGTTGQTGLTLVGTCDDGFQVDLSGDLSGPGSTGCVNGNFSVGITFSAGDGNKNIVASQTDGAGNIGSDNRDFMRDNSAPAIQITAPDANTRAQLGITVSGNCESGYDVTLSGDVAAPVTTACGSGNFTAFVDFSPVDGNKNIVATQTDGAGNTGTDNRTFIRDSSAPAIMITSPAPNTRAQSGLNLSGTCETGFSVDLSGDLTGPANTTCSGGTFAVDITFTNGDGTKNIVASQTDGAGNTASDNRDFIKDTVAPIVTIASPAPGLVSNANMTVTGTCESGINVVLSGDISTNATATCSGGTYSANIILSNGDGNKTILAAQTDQAGNSSSDSRAYTLDTTAPMVQITAPAANTAATTGLTVTGSCEAGINVVINGSGVASPVTTPCVSGNFSGNIDFTAGDGAKNVVASQTDAAGNVGSDNRNFIRDNTGPAIAITSPAAMTAAQNGVTLTGVCETGLQVDLSGGLNAPASTNCSGGSFSVDITFTNGDGVKNIVASQTDNAGNTGSDNRDFVKDTTAPAIAITAPGAGTIAQTGVTLMGNCETGLVVDLSGDLNGPSTTTCNASAFSVDIDFTAGDGPKNITVSQTDAAGNSGSDSRGFMRDSNAPAIAITSPAPMTAARTGLLLEGTCEAGIDVDLTGDLTGPATAGCIGGNFSVDIIFTAGEGVKTITASQTDSGNNSASDSRDFVKDTIAPTVTITGPVDLTEAQVGVTLVGTCESGLNVDISGGGHNGLLDTPCSGGTFSVDITFSLGDGIKNIVVSQTDGAGNTGTDDRDFIRDTQAPLVAITGPATGTTDTTGVTVTGTCENGLNVSLTGNITPTTANCIAGAFSSAVIFNGGDGLKNVIASQTDPAGNTGSDSRDFFKDTGAPMITITGPAALSEAQSGVTLVGTCETGLIINLSGDLTGPATTNCNAGNFSVAITFTAGDGTKLITASQTDSASNTGSDSRDFIKDTTAPAIIITGPAAGSQVSGGVTLIGTCESGLIVDLSGDLSGPANTNCIAGNFSADVTFTNGDGNKSITASQTDAAGNSGSDSRSFVKDSVAPVVAITSPAPSSIHTDTLTLTGSCENGLQVDLSGDLSGPASTTCSASNFSVLITLSIGDGVKTIMASQTDGAGNVGSDSRDFVKDTGAPVIAITGPAAGTEAQSGVLLVGICEDGLVVSLSGDITGPANTNCVGGNFSESVTFTNGEGTKNVVASQTDGAGNTGSDNRDFVKDSVAPALAITGPAANTVVQNSVTLVGTCENGLQVDLSGDISGPSNTICSGGNFSVDVTLSGADGSKNVVASQTDAAGNTGSDNRDFMKDGNPPVIAITGPAANTAAQNGVTVVGTCENGLSVNLSGDISATSTTCSGGIFSVAVVFSGADGSKNVVASQTDGGGNTGSDNRNFVKDTSAPVVTITGPAAGTESQNNVTLTGNCENGLQVDLSGDISGPANTSCSGGSFSAVVNFTNGDGSKTVVASQTDAAGNSGSDSRDFVRDTSAPLITITGPAANTIGQTGVTLTGSCETGLGVDLSGDISSPANTTCSAGAFSVDVTFSNVDGVKNVVASQTDAAGNTGSDNRDFIRDNDAPVVLFTNPPAGSAHQGSITVFGSCEAGFNVTLDGDTTGPVVTACAGGTFMDILTFSAGDGNKTITASQTDGGGNTGSDSRSFIKDTTAPLVNITGPAANTSSATGVTLTGTCETGLVVNLSGDITSATTACSGGAFSAAITFSNGDGVKNVVASQTDAAGNSGSDNRNFIRDAGVPLVTITGPAAGTASQTGVTLVGTCENGLLVNLSGTGHSAPASTSCSAGNFSVDIVFTNGDGNKNVVASQTDGAGNTGSDNRTFVRDTTAPNIAITGPAAGTEAQTGVTLVGTCESGIDVSIWGPGSLATIGTPCSAGTFSAWVDFSAGDGSKDINASQTDASGNFATDSRSFVRDTVGPNIAITSPAAGTLVGPSVAVGGTCETGLTVNLSGDIAATNTSCVAGAFSANVNFSAGGGNKTVTAAQTDAAGNSGSDSRNFDRDLTPPAVAITSPAANSAVAASATIGGTCENGLQVDLSGDITATNTTCSGGSFSTNVTFTNGDGLKTVTASQTDGIGNTGTDSRSFIRDTAAPVVAITSPAANSYVSASATISGNCENGLQVDLAGDITATNTTCSGGSFSTNVTFTAGDGIKNVVASQTDGIGNTGSDNRNFNLDATAPVIQITSPAPSTPGVGTITIGGICESGLIVNITGDVSAPSTTNCSGGVFSSTVTFSAVLGTKNIVASQTDGAGNTGSDNRDFENSNANGFETFTSEGTNDRIDILFIDDNSGSMEWEQQRLSDRFQEFSNSLTGVNWHMGITTTDVSTTSSYGLMGTMLDFVGHTDHILTPSVAGYEQMFKDTIIRPETFGCVGRGDCPSGREEGYAATIMAIDKRDSDNTGFFRDNANTAIVVLSDEDEQSTGPAGATTAQDVISHHSSIWPGKKITLYGIIVIPGDSACDAAQDAQVPGIQAHYGDYYQEGADITGGQTHSICAADYSLALQAVADSVVNIGNSVQLQHVPIPGTVSVTFTPSFATTWTVEGNRVVFATAPPVGTQIDVFYEY